MKKETIISIFKSLKDCNFPESSPISVRVRGVNGVAFAEYYGQSNVSNQTTRVLGLWMSVSCLRLKAIQHIGVVAHIRFISLVRTS